MEISNITTSATKKTHITMNTFDPMLGYFGTSDFWQCGQTGAGGEKSFPQYTQVCIFFLRSGFFLDS